MISASCEQAAQFLRLVTMSLLPFACLADMVFSVGTHAGQGSIKQQTFNSLVSVGGFNGFRDELYWSQLEKTEGVFALPTHLQELDKILIASPERNIKPLIILNYGNAIYGGGLPTSTAAVDAFARYCAYVSERYAGYVSYYEIWNEWNTGMGSNIKPKQPGSPSAYVNLVNACAARIRANDPEVKILVGATAGYDRIWTEDALKLGVLASADGFSVHPYVFEHHSDRRPEKSISFLRTLNSQLERYKPNTPIFVSEMGWPTSTGDVGVSEQTQANYLLRFALLASTLASVEGVSIHALIDYGNDVENREHNFGLVKIDLSAKMAFGALSAISDIVIKNAGQQIFLSSPEAFVVKFDLADNNQVFALWAQSSATVGVNISAAALPSIEYINGTQRLGSGLQNITLNESPLIVRLPHGGLSFPDLSAMSGAAPMPPVIVPSE